MSLKSTNGIGWYVVTARSDDTLILDRPLQPVRKLVCFMMFIKTVLVVRVAFNVSNLQINGCLLSIKPHRVSDFARTNALDADIVVLSDKLFDHYDIKTTEQIRRACRMVRDNVGVGRHADT